MVGTADALATERGITREELDEVTLLRYEQYTSALVDDRAFQRRYVVPAHVPRRRQDPIAVDADQGVTATTAEGLAKLAPASPEGVVTFGTQTHPADGTAGMVVTRSSARGPLLTATASLTSWAPDAVGLVSRGCPKHLFPRPRQRWMPPA